MAVNVSTITSVCVYCQANSNSSTEQDFHDIYDEVGVELQLPSLVETYFQIKVKNEGKKYLCNDCVNRLIELYDLQEHAKEERLKAAAQIELENSYKLEGSHLESETCDQQSGGVVDNIFQLENRNATQSSTTRSSNSAIVLPKEFSVKHKSLKANTIKVRSDGGSVYQKIKIAANVDYTEENDKSAVFTLENVADESDVEENVSDEEFAINNVMMEESNELTTLSSNSSIEISNSSEAECKAEFVEDVGSESSEADNLFITTKNEDIEDHTQVSATEEDHLSDIEAETVNNDDVTSNDLYEQLDDTLVENDDNGEIVLADMFHCLEDANHNNATANTNRKRAFSEITLINSNACSAEAEIYDTNLNSKGTALRLNNTEDCESSEVFEKTHSELSNDSLSLEEEYLIEEISCSEEYDEIDLNEYLDRVLLTKFQDLELKWETKCKICLNICNTFQDLLNHSCITEFQEEEQLFHCIIEGCVQNTDNLATMARHLILMHYDKLESVSIYGKCPDCQKAFSNIFDFNKHSCCRSIKKKTGSPNYCQYCDMDFQSLKRYVFHMQFHLSNRRPKVCLLCGVLFKTSNEFFEHTQYQHTSETAMACVKCDRFFKDKDVFAQHISSHDTKYQYSCTLCPKKYTNKFILAQHMDIYHSNRPTTLKCEHCDKEFVSRVSYRNHIKCHDADVEVDAFICSTCGIVTSSVENIKYHVESDEDSPCFSSQFEEKLTSLAYTCENCSLDYHTIKHLKQHRLGASHSNELFVCGICRQCFKTLRHMRNHYANHKDLEEWKAAFPITRYFVCNIGDCEEFYPIWTTLYYHKKRPHKTNKPILADEYKCQFCQQICYSKMSLAVHVARSHNNSNVKCSQCKRSFKSQKHLQEHIDKYHTPVECDICFKKFKHRRNLESHNNMVHLSIKRYFCKHCGKGYFHKSEKDIHEKKVHPKVSYNCELCNFVTTYPESLQVHMDKHNNQLKFNCTICGKAFGRKQLLQCHLKRHLNKKDFICTDYVKDEGCGSTFLTYNLLKKHIQSKHPNSNYNNNLKSDGRNKLVLKNGPEMDGIESNSIELWLDDDSASASENNTTILPHNADEDMEEDPIEMVFEEDDIQFVEQ